MRNIPFEEEILLATNAFAKKKSLAGCPIIHNKTQPMEGPPHFKYAEMKKEKARI